MKALRIILTQSSANYHVPETIEHIMTYPLPPFSTVIGSLYAACKDNAEFDMSNSKISIQGHYDNIVSSFKNHVCVYNTVMDDRGTLVKMVNPSISKAYVQIAKSLTRGSSFREKRDVQIMNEDLYNEYYSIYDKSVELKELRSKITKEINAEKASIRKKNIELKESCQEDKIEKSSASLESMKSKLNAIVEELSVESEKLEQFRLIERVQREIDIVNNVYLIIHIVDKDSVLECIRENIYNMKSIGRSEDFVDVQKCEYVDLADYICSENEDEQTHKHEMMYVKTEGSKLHKGTVYWMPKFYKTNENTGKREFVKCKCMLTENLIGFNNLLFDGEYAVSLN